MIKFICALTGIILGMLLYPTTVVVIALIYILLILLMICFWAFLGSLRNLAAIAAFGYCVIPMCLASAIRYVLF